MTEDSYYPVEPLTRFAGDLLAAGVTAALAPTGNAGVRGAVSG